MWTNTLGGSLFGTMSHGKTDAEATEPAKAQADRLSQARRQAVSFDRLTNVSFSMTNHEESQPAHLHLKDPEMPIR
jgi:electron-transferring-flavoprotein dehydrogenase